MTAKLTKLATRTRYARNRKGKPNKLRIGGKAVPKLARQVPGATIRCNELERYFMDRYDGGILPDDDAGRDDAEIMLHHIYYRQVVDRVWLMHDKLDRFAPWLIGDEREEMIARVFRKPMRYTADTLAEKLGMTYARRQRLAITMIGSTDVDADARKMLRAARDRENKRKAREEKGCTPRSEYEAKSAEKTKPWIAEGISRRTWCRRQAKAKAHYAVDALVPRVWFAKVRVSVA